MSEEQPQMPITGVGRVGAFGVLTQQTPQGKMIAVALATPYGVVAYGFTEEEARALADNLTQAASGIVVAHGSVPKLP